MRHDLRGGSLTRIPLVVSGIAGALGLACAVASGCGVENGPPASLPRVDASDASETSEASTDAATDTSVVEPTPPRPDFVPEGWELWTDFKKAAQIYLPSRKDLLPPPAAWEPCDPAFFPSNAPGSPACEQWAKVEPGQVSAGTMSGFGDHTPSTGRVLVPQSREFERYRTWVVVDVATGEVQNALMAASSDWVANPQWPSARASLYRIDTYGTPGATRGYLIAPHDPAAARFGGTVSSGIDLNVGDSVAGATRAGAVVQGPWSNPFASVIKSDATLQPLLRFYRGDTAYIESTYGTLQLFQVVRSGSSPETWFDNSANMLEYDTRVATDGVDVAWAHNEGCRGTACASTSLYVAKVPPAGQRPLGRRLRSIPLGVQSTVGCGYVASFAGYADYLTELRVTRIADGTSFLRRQVDRADYGYLTAVSVTCEHVYFVRTPKSVSEPPNLVRIRLDALGPAIPPD